MRDESFANKIDRADHKRKEIREQVLLSGAIISTIPASPSLTETPYVKRLLSSEGKIAGKIDQDGESLYIDFIFNGDKSKRQLIINGTTEELEKLSQVLDLLLTERYKQDEADNREFDECVARMESKNIMQRNPHCVN